MSYVIAPYGWSEHPAASPDYGAHYTNAVVQALFSNPDTWASTVLLVNYDENDGYFDHVVPPFAEPGTPDEYVDGLPIGMGARVPMTVVSPVEPWRVGQLAGGRPHLGDPVPRARHGRPRAEHLRLAADRLRAT